MLLEAGTRSAEIRDNGNGLVDDDGGARAAKRSRVEEDPPCDPAAVPAAAGYDGTPYRDGATTAPGRSREEEPQTIEVELSPESQMLNARLAETMTRTDELLTLHAKQHQDTIRCRWQLEQAQRQERAAVTAQPW